MSVGAFTGSQVIGAAFIRLVDRVIDVILQGDFGHTMQRNSELEGGPSLYPKFPLRELRLYWCKGDLRDLSVQRALASGLWLVAVNPVGIDAQALEHLSKGYPSTPPTQSTP